MNHEYHINRVKTAALKKNSKQTAKPEFAAHTFYLGKSAFISIELDSSKRVFEELPPLKLENTGVIIIQIDSKSQHHIVQLLTKDYKIITQQRNTKKVTFEDLKPGDYQIRFIQDTNNDGIWNPGNFFKGQQPEEIQFYKNEKDNPIINLKANWELGPLLITH